MHLLRPPSQPFLVPWLSQLIAPRNASLLCPVLFQLSLGPSPQVQALVLLPLPPHTYQTAQPPFTPSSREPISTESLPKSNFLVTKILHDQISPRVWCLSSLPPFCTSSLQMHPNFPVPYLHTASWFPTNTPAGWKSSKVDNHLAFA